MTRRMADANFRKEQHDHRFDDHIAPINRLVDELRKENGKRWAPYVAPLYGGVNARLLSILRDPGPKTRPGKKGSGFLCLENDDATAAKICELIVDAGIDVYDMLPWNAYPWYINRAPKAAELNDGVEPLKRLIDLLPKLRVVMLHGGSAKDCWKRFTCRYPNIVDKRGLEVIGTYHPSRQAFWHRDEAEREARRKQLHDSFHQAADNLSSDIKGKSRLLK